MRKFAFVQNLKKYLIISGIFFAVIIAASFVFGLTLDIEFRGGSIITYSYEGDLDLESFQRAASDAAGIDVSIQKSENIVTGQQTIIVSLPGNDSLSVDEMSAVAGFLRTGFPENNVQTAEVSNVNPVIGAEFLLKCLVAMLAASILIVLYVAFRFRKIGGASAGVSAIIALVHDVFISFGVFVLFGIPINENFIVVILTILGFSINNAIVVYDRIRENQKLLPRTTGLTEITNLAINQSVRRSIVTTGSAILALIVVSVVALVYNVDSIQSFSFPLIIGLIAGLYSSLCLSGPMWVWWRESKAKRTARTS